MTLYLAVVATVATVTSILRLALAWADFRRRWVRLPSERVWGA